MTDCLFIGMNSQEFSKYLGMVAGLGTDSGAYRDLRLSFIEHEGRPVQAMELLSIFHKRNGGTRKIPFHNADFIWPTITYLGTYISRRGMTFDYVNSFQHEKELLREKLTSGEVMALIIPTTLYVVPWPIQEIIAFARECNERVKIIVGGPYISNLTKSGDRKSVEDQLRAIGADYYVISSEGEASFAALLEVLKHGGDLSKIDNLAYPDGTDFVFTKTNVERNALEENMVDYTLFKPEEMGQFVSTRTAKSCPFACAFCNFPQQAGAYTFMSVEAVERELDAIRALGTVTTLTFIDDTFNVPKKRFAELLRMMIRNDYRRDFKWNCTLRSDHCDDEIISLMGKAGCEGVFLGVESGSDRMLKTMNKTARRADYMWAIPRLKEEGILAHANLFIGFPGETMDTVEETMDLIRQARPETFSAQPWYANPLTPVWKKRDEYQIKGSSFKWSHNTMDAATACDLVDRVFLTVDESTFLPQYGFFQWSLFYLQRHGMALDRIKGYLGSFNALVREKMVGRSDAHDALMSNLEAAARFVDTQVPEPLVTEIFTGGTRRAAEQYCSETFGSVDRKRHGLALAESLSPLQTAFASQSISVPSSFLERWGHDLDHALLAAYAVLVWRLDELRDVFVLVRAPEHAPLALKPDVGLRFEDWVTRVAAVTAEGMLHRQHAFDILSGRSVLYPFRANKPRFQVAFDCGAAAHDADDVAVAKDVLVRLSVSEGASVKLAARCRESVLVTLAASFDELCRQLGDRPDVTLGAAMDQSVGGGASAGGREYSEETFAF